MGQLEQDNHNVQNIQDTVYGDQNMPAQTGKQNRPKLFPHSIPPSFPLPVPKCAALFAQKRNGAEKEATKFLLQSKKEGYLACFASK